MPERPELRADTVMLRVADLERAATFYGKAVGLRETGRQPGLAFFDAGPIRIALQQLPKQLPAGDQNSMLALTEVVLHTDDIGASMTALKSGGVKFLCGDGAAHVASMPDHDLYAAPFRDPDGHVLSLLARVPKAGEAS